MADQSTGTVGKWLLGILTAVLTGVLVWWLTHPGGPLNPEVPPATPKPVLRIVDVRVTAATVGGRASATVGIYNEGDVTGEACTVWWYSGDTVAHELEQGKNASEATTSREFGITPDQTQQVQLDSGIYTSPGTYGSYFQASCAGTNIVSREYHQDVVVNP